MSFSEERSEIEPNYLVCYQVLSQMNEFYFSI